MVSPVVTLLEAYKSYDIAGVGFFDVLPAVGVHAEYAAYPVLLFFGGIVNLAAHFDNAAVYAEEGKLTPQTGLPLS